MLLLVVSTAPLHAQRIFSRADLDLKSGAPGLSSSARALSLDVDLAAFRRIVSSTILLEDVPLAAGISVDLELEEFSVLLPGTVPVVTTAFGDMPLPAPSVRLYRGRVSGDRQSSVFIAIGARSVLGSISTAGSHYEISTDPTRPADAGSLGALVYPFADASTLRAPCGVTETMIERMMDGIDTEKGIARPSNPHVLSLPDDLVEYAVKGAFETDLEYLASFDGDLSAALDFAVVTLGRVSATFESEVSCQIGITHLRIWATDDCPYKESGDIYRAVQQVQDHWSPTSIPERAFLMVLSGKPWQNPIGVVTDVNRLCNASSAYAYSIADPLYPARTYTSIAHELGHLFGAHHTHNCPQWNGQLDHCFFPEQGSCFSEIKDTIGTLMSYCSTRIPSFGPVVGSFLKNRTAARFNSGTSCVVASRSMAAAPATITFPTAELGLPVDTILTDFFRNNGRSDITVTEFSLSGSDPGAFVVAEPTEFPFTLSAGESRELKLVYLAPGTGAASATLTIQHDGYNPALRVLLQGSAMEHLPLLGFDRISPSRFLDFGTPNRGEAADTSFEFVNRGTAPLSVTKTEIVGRDRLEFELVTGNAPFTLAPGAGREAKLRLTGTTNGLKQAWLRIESNSAGSGLDSIRLTAVVVTGPLLEIRAANRTIDFGKVSKGNTGDTTIAPFFVNAGSDTLRLATSTAGPDAPEFTVADMNVAIPPDSSVALAAIFRPDALKPIGEREAWLIVRVDGRSRIDTVRLIAEVVAPTGITTPGRDDKTSLVVAPNPAAEDVTVMIRPAADESGRHYSVRILDAAGQEVLSTSGRLDAAPVALRLKKGDLPPGVYYVSVTTTSRTQTASITILP